MRNGPSTSSGETLRPTRYVLTPAEVAAGFSAAGAAPPRSAFYDGLPPADARLPPALTGASGKLSEEARAVFASLAEPRTIVSLECVTPPSPAAIGARFVSGPSGRFVMLTRPEPDEWDLALLTGPAQVLALLDELSGASLGPGTDGAKTFALDASALVALAALADEAAKCEALERLGTAGALLSFLSSPVAVNDLVDAAERAQAAPTTLQAVTLLSLLTDIPLGTDNLQARIEDGMEGLAAQGLVRDDSTLTAAGVGLCRLLSRVRTASSLQVVKQAGTELQLDRFLMLRTDAALLAGLWDGTEAGSARLNLREVSAATLWRIVAETISGSPMLASGIRRREAVQKPLPAAPEPATGGRYCSGCGRELRASVRFCTACGAKVEPA